MNPAQPRQSTAWSRSRRRPARPGRLLLALALALVALVALAVFIALRYVFANPNPTANYASTLNQQLLAHAPPGDNAWPLYRDLIRNRLTAPVEPPESALERFATFQDLLMERDPELRRRPVDLLVQGDWGDPRLDSSKQAHDQLRVLLPALDQAAAKPRFVKFYYPGSDALAQTGLPPSGKPTARMFEILLPELGSLLALARLNAAAMREAAQQGDWGEVVRRLRTGLSMGAQLARQDTLIEGLVAVRMQTLTLEELQHLLNERDIPQQTLDGMRAAIEAHDMPSKHSLDWLEGERVLLLDAVQWMYSSDGVLVTWVMDGFTSGPSHSPTIWQRLANVVAIAMPSRSQTERAINRFIDAARDYARAPLAEKQAKGRIVEERAAANRILEVLAPAFSRALLQLERHAAERAATLLMLRLEELHARTGAWPVSLEDADLGDAILEPATGAPFVYRRLDGDPQGRPYVLDYPASLRARLAPDLPDEINAPREPLPEPAPWP